MPRPRPSGSTEIAAFARWHPPYRVDPAAHRQPLRPGEPPPYRLTFSSQGSRGEELRPDDGRPALRILVMGDSTLFGAGVDQPLIASERLKDALRRRYPSHNVNVANVASPGSNLALAVGRLQHQWAAFQPHWIVLGANNDSLFASTGTEEILAKLSLYRLVVHVAVRDGWLAGDDLAAPRPELFVHSLSNFENNLRAISGLSSTWGGRVMFVSLPRYVPEPGLPCILSLHPVFRAAAKRIMQERGQVFLDVAARFPESDPRWFLSDRPDEVHPNGDGNAILADAIFEAITAR